MNLSELSDQAIRVQRRFEDRQARQGLPPWGPAEIMQGFVGDVGDLAKLVMARNGFRPIPDAAAKLRHELADCLWSVLVLARAYDVDLEAAFAHTLAEIEAKLG